MRAFLVLFAVSPMLACGGGDGPCKPAGTQSSKFVLDAITVPKTKNEYALDQNGDGMPDNQLGAILGLLASSGVNPQSGVDDAFASGKLTVLVEERSADSSFQTDTCGSSTLSVGQSATMAKPTADQSFTVDGTITPVTFAGPIAAGVFSTESPI